LTKLVTQAWLLRDLFRSSMFMSIYALISGLVQFS